MTMIEKKNLREEKSTDLFSSLKFNNRACLNNQQLFLFGLE